MTAVKHLALLVEDDSQIRRFLRTTLTSHDYRLLEAINAQQGLQLATTHSPDIILLDLGLPDQDGLEVTKQLRSWSSMPIIVLSARGQEHDKVAALDAGADDYLSKPFGVGELMARMRVALRHAFHLNREQSSPIFEMGELRIDLAARKIFNAGQELHLTPIEFKLVSTLVKHAGKVVTHSQLLKEAWGPRFVNEVQYLRVYMGQLRRKVERDPAQPSYILTEQGVGYRLRSE